jgi:hypothetical protein
MLSMICKINENYSSTCTSKTWHANMLLMQYIAAKISRGKTYHHTTWKQDNPGEYRSEVARLPRTIAYSRPMWTVPRWRLHKLQKVHVPEIGWKQHVTSSSILRGIVYAWLSQHLFWWTYVIHVNSSYTSGASYQLQTLFNSGSTKKAVEKLTITENALSQKIVPSASGCWLPCTMTDTGKDNCWKKHGHS